MEADIFEYAQEPQSEDPEFFIGEKRKLIQPTSLKDSKLIDLKEALVDWINSTLKPEHIVVQTLEEDLFDGLVLHHLLMRLAKVKLPVEEIALTSAAQTHKLEVILGQLSQHLGLEEDQTKWSVQLIHNKDLLATVHLLVAMVKRFQPELELPSDVEVEVVVVEVSKNGIKSEIHKEMLTEKRVTIQTEENTFILSRGRSTVYVSTFKEHRSADPDSQSNSKWDHPIDQLLRLDTSKVNTVKQAILHFVNTNMSSLGLQVADMGRQFADGVILLLLIGQLEGYFIPLHDFNLTPVNQSEMLHNVTLALDLLIDAGMDVSSISPQDIVSQELQATLKVLYALFKKHKEK
ncbi:gamma-parvin isoform X1 [Boleophthalmus pectinirostris]|uniref:gamma-parvin isoform X1 n=1 Tax=Boleophthalmus pectinirostris TaxID=150288 RepID=UPI00242CCC5A|nr:gamma-parvin isoform X1 [Boleophthalmus pectinirostris]